MASQHPSRAHAAAAFRAAWAARCDPTGKIEAMRVHEVFTAAGCAFSSRRAGTC